MPTIERLHIEQGQTLALRVWDGSDRSAETTKGKTFVYLNGLESHGLWASNFAAALSQRGHRFVALDRRGSGANRSLSGRADDWIADVIRVCETERGGDGRREVCVIAQCFGARSAIGAALRRPDLIGRLILCSPGLAMQVDLSAGGKMLVAFAQALRLPIRLRSPISDDRLLTRDPQSLTFIGSDPLRLRRVAAGDFYAGHVLLGLIRQCSQPLSLPCLALFAKDDPVVNVPGTIDLLRRLFYDRLTVREFSEADHLLLFGRAGEQALDAILKDIAEKQTMNDER